MPWIYALTDTDGAVRYVGQTKHTLNVRLSNHISAARNKGERHKAAVSVWIRTLLGRGDRPSIIELAWVSWGGRMKKEKAWVDFYSSKGVVLLNHTNLR